MRAQWRRVRQSGQSRFTDSMRISCTSTDSHFGELYACDVLATCMLPGCESYVQHTETVNNIGCYARVHALIFHISVPRRDCDDTNRLFDSVLQCMSKSE